MEHTDKPKEDNLTQKQRNAIPHLIAPGTTQQKARNAGVSARTLRRWLQDSKFRKMLKEAGEEAMKLAASQLEVTSHQAVSTLYEALHDGEVNVRIRAAQTLLKYGQSAHYGERLEERMDFIEEAMQLKEDLNSERGFA